MTKALTIDASALSGVDFNSYINTFFSSLAADSNDFYGGTPDIFYGRPYNVSGSQVLSTYTEGEAASPSVALIEGADLAYDYIHYGSSFGHGISGHIDSLTFGTWVDGVATGTQGIGESGEIAGLATGLLIDGLDLSAAAGSGTDTSTNLVYGVYKAVNALDAAYLYDLISTYAVEFTGSAGNDSVVAYNHDDVLMGGAGNDTMRGAGGRDVLLGDAGDDLLFGNGGADILRGGSGADRLVGGGGRDLLTGGSGADTFIIAKLPAQSDIDIITDFETGVDRLSLRQFGLTSLDDLTVTETADYVDLVTGTQTIRLEGLTAADLDSVSILF
ncbi:calcium-binding protein [Neotabrizicola shimadae]|uniref:Uncharacterized protein n=1 Tax=Neotabrizicola shimadae TaxID=2807096 RepID=A0A8G1EAI6_9RHOB|nr:hypothetical protein [Neotabrizicola shimadae]QYZ68650.1 hypothetical protein JO391_12805 [Neotabrizicola shimadae]